MLSRQCIEIKTLSSVKNQARDVSVAGGSPYLEASPQTAQHPSCSCETSTPNVMLGLDVTLGST